MRNTVAIDGRLPAGHVMPECIAFGVVACINTEYALSVCPQRPLPASTPTESMKRPVSADTTPSARHTLARPCHQGRQPPAGHPWLSAPRWAQTPSMYRLGPHPRRRSRFPAAAARGGVTARRDPTRTQRQECSP
jgi:hypothetical protein